MWAIPAIAPMLLPWVAILALLLLPSNRTPRAWLILVPLGFVAGTSGLIEQLFGTGEPGYIAQLTGAGAFGIAALWLLAEPLRRRGRVLSLLLGTLAGAAWSVVGFAITTLASEMADARQHVPFLLLWAGLFWTTAALAVAGGLPLAGALSRHRYGWFRTLFWMSISLWAIWVGLGLVFFGIMALNEGGVELWESLVGLSIVSLIHLGVCLPFLTLAFTNSFFRRRLKALMRLKEQKVLTETSLPLPQPTISRV